MDMFLINGGKKLCGQVEISGNKNSALPILIASLLSEQPSCFSNVPNLSDIKFLLDLISSFGVRCTKKNNKMVTIDACNIKSSLAHYDMVRKMRASVLTLAPLLARKGFAKVSLPGGCAIGARPIDLHLEGLKAFGAQIEVQEGYVYAHLPKGTFVGAEFELRFPSVGATEQLVMAAVMAHGKSVLKGVAMEPEVIELCNALNEAGANIKGHGTSVIEITGVTSLNGFHHKIHPDRIEVGTFIAVSALTKSSIVLNNVRVGEIKNILQPFLQAGVMFEFDQSKVNNESLKVIPPSSLKATDLKTGTYPDFPTDMQAQFMACMTVAEGKSKICETIFENRMMHVPELTRLGAQIDIKDKIAHVSGVKELVGAPVMATDLRASASLVIAALAAKGKSEIRRVYHLDRGYEGLEVKLSSLGAMVKRVEQN